MSDDIKSAEREMLCNAWVKEAKRNSEILSQMIDQAAGDRVAEIKHMINRINIFIGHESMICDLWAENWLSENDARIFDGVVKDYNTVKDTLAEIIKSLEFLYGLKSYNSNVNVNEVTA